MELLEKKTVLLVSLIHFINICDFMMIMPLGPDYIFAIGSSADKIGIIAAAYSFSATITGFLASFILDRFDRKKAILFCLMGLIIATSSTALAFDIYSMAFARLTAGAFGGPLTALALSMITDIVPAERRGAAMGKVMSAFSLASFLGIPFGLELSKLLGWKSPFLVLSFVALFIWLWAKKNLPNKINIITHHNPLASIIRVKKIISRPTSLTALPIIMIAMAGMFMIVPNISAHFQFNLNFPRNYLSLLYLMGGATTFFTVRIVGKIVDQKGPVFVAFASYFLMCFSLYFGFIIFPSFVPAWLIFLTMMVAASSRNVAVQTLSSKVPNSDERGTYFAISNTLQNLGTAAGAYIASLMLFQQGNTLEGMPKVASYSLLFASLIPLMFILAEKQLRHRDQCVCPPTSL